MSRYIDADKLVELLETDNFYTPDERWRPESEFYEMVMAITPIAVDRTQQRPKYLTVEYSKELNDTVRSGSCPTCGRYLCEWKQHKSDHYFCEKCGQEIDWGWGDERTDNNI